MPNYTGIITYTLYDFNDKQGRVPFLDATATRALLAAQIRINCALSDS
jgi:hypothetical protein